MADDVPDYTTTTWNPDAAPGISAAELQRLDDQIKALTDEFNLHNGGRQQDDHGEASSSLRGFMSAAHKAKLDNIEANATQDETAIEHRAAILSVDGPGSGINADLLDDKELANLGPAISHFDAQVERELVAIGTSLTAHHSVTFTRPSGWTNFNLMAIANALYENGSGTAVLTANLEAGGFNSGTVTGSVLANTISATLVCCRVQVFGTSTVTVRMETIRVGGTQADAISTSYQFIAVRES